MNSSADTHTACAKNDAMCVSSACVKRKSGVDAVPLSPPMHSFVFDVKDFKMENAARSDEPMTKNEKKV